MLASALILWENLLKVRQSLGLAGSVPVTAREDESEEAALQRRLRESARVEERVIQIYNEKEFQQQLEEVSWMMHLHLIVGTSFSTHNVTLAAIGLKGTDMASLTLSI